LKGNRVAQIVRAELNMVNLAPKVRRTDAIQSFVSQETPILTLTDSDGAQGTGYTYTIGSGGSAVVALLKDHLLPRLMGQEANHLERVWRDLLFSTHATSVGAITSLSLAAIDTALWDLRCKRAGLPLCVAAGGAKESLPLYTTEGGWLHLPTEALVEDALEMQRRGFLGAKLKVGKPHPSEDFRRLAAVREAVGDAWEIMTDANQGLLLEDALRRSRMLGELGIAWFEEPLPADDVLGHAVLCAQSPVPIAVGESLYSLSQFKDYLQARACSIVQVDVARIGGITPWLKVAHLAESYNVVVCPHFLMELHASLACAIPNSRWVEYIPQLDGITTAGLEIKEGQAFPSTVPGLGIEWDWSAITQQQVIAPLIFKHGQS
jgi:L-alanine-DL-glutamate epimerase-like enolase superfamily enzyme